MHVSENSTVLSSWKDIAKYLGKGVRTVQRWERHLGLPVRRPIGASQKSAVVLYSGEVDAWLATRFSARTLKKNGSEGSRASRSARSTLKQGIRTARELRSANHQLTEQITASIRLLTERCDRLTTQSLPELSPSNFAGSAILLTTELTSVAELLPSSGAVPSERIA